MKISAYRVVRSVRATDAFTGEGARVFGGRWNAPGQPVTYLSGSRALAVLEILVHQSDLSPQAAFVRFEAVFSESLITVVDPTSLRRSWRRYPPGPETQSVGARWLAAAGTPVLRVPSVLIPEEPNYLFNPLHPRHGEIAIGPAEPFALDSRLEPHAARTR